MKTSLKKEVFLIFILFPKNSLLGIKPSYFVTCPFWLFLPALWRGFFYAVWDYIIH